MGCRELVKAYLLAFVFVVANASLVEENDEFPGKRADAPRKRRRGLSIISNLLNDMGLNEVRAVNVLN
jgi:hypothetical protein